MARQKYTADWRFVLLFRFTCSRWDRTPSRPGLVHPDGWTLIRDLDPDHIGTAPQAVSGCRMTTPALYQAWPTSEPVPLYLRGLRSPPRDCWKFTDDPASEAVYWVRASELIVRLT